MLKTECTRNCWLAAAVAGLLVWIFNATLVGGFVMGLLAFVMLGNTLIWLVCAGRGGVHESTEALGAKAFAHNPPEAEAEASVLARAENAIAEAGAAFASGTVAALEKGREAIHDHTAAASGLPAAPVAPKDAVQPAKSQPAAKAAKPAAKVARPAAKAAKAKPAVADNLKEIKGVGPQLEKLLHDNGVTSFAQIASWGEAEIDHFAAAIGRMGGRIRSDDWVAQAKLLAAGGETEFSRRVDKGEVY